MNRVNKHFKALFFKELRDSYHYPLAVVGVLLAASLLFNDWAGALRSSQHVGVLALADALIVHFAGLWGRLAVLSVFIVATLLPAGMFARERQTKEIACLERFPIPLQTVVGAKFSAALVLTTFVAAAFVLIGLSFDLLYGYEPFSALNAFCAQFEPREIANLRAFSLSPIELLVWGAFWATRIRREAFVVAASFLSTFAVWGLVGYVVICVDAAPRGSVLVDSMRQSLSTEYLQYVFCGGVASVESAFYATLRFGALLAPLVGTVCVFRKNGVKTMLSNGLNGFGFCLKTFLTKRRRHDATSASASVPVDSNASAKRRERSVSVFDRLVSATPRRFRPLAALCLETIKNASLFGRFRGAVAIDLLIFNLLFLNITTNVAQTGAFLSWFLFVVLFGTGAFAGLRRDRSILTTRLPVSPSVYYASQLLAYAALYGAAYLPATYFQHLFPEAANVLRNLFAETPLELDASLRQTQGFWFFGAYHWFVVFCASAVGRTRLGAAILSVLFYIAVFGVKLELYGLADGTPPEAAYTLVYLPALVVGIASYPLASRRFRRSQ